MTKTEAVLLFNDLIHEKGFIVKTQYMKLTGVAELTFRRYLRVLREYYAKKKPIETIDYDKIKDVYVLGTNKKK